MDMATAAAFFVVYQTAYTTLRTVAELEPDDWVVVLGAAGGVGLAAVELGQILGGRVLAAASSDDKLAVCLKMGALETINYDREDLKARIKEICGGGADIVVDPVGGAYSEQALRATRFGGRFVSVGFATGEIPRIPLNLVLVKGVHVLGFDSRAYGIYREEEVLRDRAELQELFMSGRLHPHISARYTLDEVTQAMKDVEERRAVGKIVIEPWA